MSQILWGLDTLLFPEFMDIASILFYSFIEFIMLLYTFLVIYFAQYKEYIIFLISFGMFSYVLPAFTWVSAIVNISIICSGVNIFSLHILLYIYLQIATKNNLTFFLLNQKDFQHFVLHLLDLLILILSFLFFIILPRSDLKLHWFFNTFFGFTIPSLKLLNKSIGFWSFINSFRPFLSV